MSQTHAPDAQDPPPADRRAQVAERTRQLRSLGVAGAVATLGVFAGLAAATHSGSAATTQPAAGSDGAAPDAATQLDDDQFDQFDGSDRFDQFDGSGFFDPGGGSSGISPGGSGSSAGATSGGS